MRFNTTQFRSLNEAINNVQKNEDLEYIELLEDALLFFCEELDIDPATLLEDLQTPARERETSDHLGSLHRRAKQKGDAFVRARPFSVASRKHENDFDAVSDELDNKIRDVKKERRSPILYGKGGKIVQKLKTKKAV